MHNDAVPDGYSRQALGLLSVLVWLWNTVEKNSENQTAIAVKSTCQEYSDHFQVEGWEVETIKHTYI